MSEEIKVTVIRYPDRENLVLAYIDPVSNKRKTRTAGTPDEAHAWKAAARWEEELRSGQFAPPSKITWSEFRARYMEEHVASLAPTTAEVVRGALHHVERHLNPDKLCKVNAAALSTLQAKLRATGIREATVAAVLRMVKAALSWAVKVGMLPAVPKVVMPKKAKGRKMKGGAVVAEQFDRMLEAVGEGSPPGCGRLAAVPDRPVVVRAAVA
jgi:hypothetical protein